MRVKGCFYIKPPYGKDKPLLPADWKCQVVSSGQRRETMCSVMCVLPRTNTTQQSTNVLSAKLYTVNTKNLLTMSSKLVMKRKGKKNWHSL